MDVELLQREEECAKDVVIRKYSLKTSLRAFTQPCRTTLVVHYKV
jgi:hypothetical protein